MARMFPERFPDSSPSHAERRVFEALRDGLGDPYVVFAQVAWLASHPGGRPREGETDVVIAHPEWGMLAIEVKGGIITFDPADGWTSNGRPIKDPVAQVRGAAHDLGRYLREVPSTRTYSYPFGYAVWFPDGDAVRVRVRPDAPAEIVLGAAELGAVGEAVGSLFDHWLGRTQQPGPGPTGIEALIRLLGRHWTFGPLLGAEIGRVADQLRTLTEQQFGLLTFLGNRPRALIAGCAGSGKTMLAAEKARRLARSGFRVLFTCYNKSLAARLRADLGSDPSASGVEVVHFHELCYRLGREADIDLPPQGATNLPDEYFSTRLPVALSEAAARLGPRYDAIVVDEGQDFQDVWWLPLLELLHDPEHGVLYIFFDDYQDIYRRDRAWPIPDPPYQLTTNCRNTQTIHREVVAAIDGKLEATCQGPEGRAVERIAVASEASEANELRKALHRLIHDEDVDPRDVVILTPRRQGRSALGEGLPLGNLRLTWFPDPARHQVQVSTIHSFKGLERPIVILAEQAHAHPRQARELLYVARSRATSHLIELRASAE